METDIGAFEVKVIQAAEPACHGPDVEELFHDEVSLSKGRGFLSSQPG